MSEMKCFAFCFSFSFQFEIFSSHFDERIFVTSQIRLPLMKLFRLVSLILIYKSVFGMYQSVLDTKTA